MRRFPGVPQPRNVVLRTPLWYTQRNLPPRLNDSGSSHTSATRLRTRDRHLTSTRQPALSRCISRRHSVGALSDKVNTSLHSLHKRRLTEQSTSSDFASFILPEPDGSLALVSIYHSYGLSHSHSPHGPSTNSQPRQPGMPDVESTPLIHRARACACIPNVYASRVRKCEDSRTAGPVPYVDNTSSIRVRKGLQEVL
jgi:hypothetical protein